MAELRAGGGGFGGYQGGGGGNAADDVAGLPALFDDSDDEGMPAFMREGMALMGESPRSAACRAAAATASYL